MFSTGVLLVVVAACSVATVLMTLVCIIACRRLVEKMSNTSNTSRDFNEAVFHIPVPVLYSGTDQRYIIIPPSETCSTLPAYTPTDMCPPCIGSDVINETERGESRLDRPPSYMEALCAKETQQC